MISYFRDDIQKVLERVLRSEEFGVFPPKVESRINFYGCEISFPLSV